MEVSASGLAFIKDKEGFEPHVYKDSAGLETIGVGHLLTRGELADGQIIINGVAVPYGNGLTDQQVLDLLAQDIKPKAQAVTDSVHVPLTQGQFDALVSLCFNIGESNFCGSTLVKLLNASDTEGAAGQFARWDRAGGRVVRGLVVRRAAEARLFREGR